MKRKMLFTYKTWVFVVFNLILGLHAHVPLGAVLSDQQRLYKNLFNESYYSPDLVPVLNKSHVITVHFGFELVNIVQVNAKEQLIVVYGWLRQHWVNHLLTWNASDFGGIEYLHVPAKTVWIPDILLYNNIDSHQQYVDQTSAYRSDVMIYSNGTNVWRNQAIMKSLCSVEVTYFPFDNQTCQLKFGSWMYDTRIVDIQPIKGQTFPTKHFQENGEWDINKVRMRRNEVHYQCCANTFADVTVTIEMARDSMDYFINLILPCCLISSMIFLGFILPPETGERIGLSITVLLAMTVFQQLTSELMPSYDFPILAQYYFAIILEIGASVLVTTMILNFYHRTNRKMPWWMRRLVIEWIAAIVFLKDTPEKRKINRRKSSRKSRRHRRDKRSSVKINKESKDGDQHNQGFSVTFSDMVYCGSQNSEPINMELNNLGHQNAYLPHQSSADQATDEARPYTDDGENPSEDELAIRHWEWTLVARILDRFFLVVAIICGIVTVSAIFLRAPKLWTNTTKLTLDNPQDIVEE